MEARSDLVSQLRVASPCSAAWDEMAGDERVRFCGQCRKHVYNLTVLSPDEVGRLVQEKEGRFCGRIYQRRDGMALSANCPVGVARIRRALLASSGALAMLFLAVPVVAAALRRIAPDAPLWKREPWATIGVRLGVIPPRRLNTFGVTMGDMAVPMPVAKTGNQSPGKSTQGE